MNTSGANNTALGYTAGDNITTGSSNIIIGSGVDAPSATASNQVVIGQTIKWNNTARSQDVIVVKEGSTGSFSFTASEMANHGDNWGALVHVQVHRPTSDVTNDSASGVCNLNMPRGSWTTISTISSIKGGGISTFTISISGNTLVVTTDSNVSLSCVIRVFSSGGMS